MKSSAAIHVLAAVLAMALPCTARADVASDWVSLAIDSSLQARESPKELARTLGIVRNAMQAAIAGHNGNGNGHSESSTDPRAGTERSDAAAAVAAFAVLESLYPEQRENLEARLAVTFSFIPETTAKAEGAATGRRVATELLRAN